MAKDRPCTFELHLEGPTTSSPGTAAFVEDCTKASPTLRTKIRDLLTAALGREATGVEVEDFLSRLRIRPHQPSQRDINDKCIRILGQLAPTLRIGDVTKLFDDLLQIVEGAQDASHDAIGEGIGFLEAQLAYLLVGEPSAEQVVACKRLSRHVLAGLVPVPDQPQALLLIERSMTGKPATALEEKLIAAGASAQVIQRARGLRAMSEMRRLELLAGPTSRDAQLEDVCSRVRIHAEGRAQLCKTNGESVNDLFAHLTIDQSIEDSDQASLFNRDRLALVGLLCCLSDECLFGWRAP